MSVLAGELLVKVTGDSKDVKAELKTAEKETDSFVAKLEKNKKKVEAVTKAFAVASAAMTGILALSLREAAKQEAAETRLSAALRTLGKDTSEVRNQFKGMANELQQLTGMADDEMLDSMTQLINITGDYNMALENTKLVADVSRGAQVNMATAARLVGMAYIGQTAQLTRYGIKLEEGVKGTEALIAVQSRFAGQAEAFGNTLKGQTQLLMNNIGDIAEMFGMALLPQVTTFLKSTNELASSLTQLNPGVVSVTANLGLFSIAVTGLVAGVGLFTLAIMKLRGAIIMLSPVTNAFLLMLRGHPIIALVTAIGLGIVGLITLAEKYVEANAKMGESMEAADAKQRKIHEDKLRRAEQEFIFLKQNTKLLLDREEAGEKLSQQEEEILRRSLRKLQDLQLEIQDETRLIAVIDKKTESMKKSNNTEKAAIDLHKEHSKRIKQLVGEYENNAAELESFQSRVQEVSSGLSLVFETLGNEIFVTELKLMDAIKLVMKTMLDTIIDAFILRLKAQMAIYVAQMFDPAHTATATAGIIATGGQIAGLALLKGMVGRLFAMADGGIVTRATPALIGEAGPEAVIPLRELQPMIQEAVDNSITNNNITFIINADRIDSGINWDALIKSKIKPALERNLRQQGRSL